MSEEERAIGGGDERADHRADEPERRRELAGATQLVGRDGARKVGGAHAAHRRRRREQPPAQRERDGVLDVREADGGGGGDEGDAEVHLALAAVRRPQPERQRREHAHHRRRRQHRGECGVGVAAAAERRGVVRVFAEAADVERDAEVERRQQHRGREVEDELRADRDADAGGEAGRDSRLGLVVALGAEGEAHLDLVELERPRAPHARDGGARRARLAVYAAPQPAARPHLLAALLADPAARAVVAAVAQPAAPPHLRRRDRPLAALAHLRAQVVARVEHRRAPPQLPLRDQRVAQPAHLVDARVALVAQPGAPPRLRLAQRRAAVHALRDVRERRRLAVGGVQRCEEEADLFEVGRRDGGEPVVDRVVPRVGAVVAAAVGGARLRLRLRRRARRRVRHCFALRAPRSSQLFAFTPPPLAGTRPGQAALALGASA